MDHRQDSDDLDDIMSQIMHSPQPPITEKRFRRQKRAASPVREAANSSFHKTTQPKTRRKRNLRGVWLSAIILILGLGGGYFLWVGPIQGLLFPSPFSKEVKQASSSPLYYPTSLPSGYEIRKEAIKPPTSGVVVYAIGNGTTQIAVTMQKKPSNLNLEPVLKLYKDLGTVETPVGTAHVGLDDTGAIIAHILTPQTWMIMNTDAKAMPRADFETILKTLKQG